nr:MAG TPA: hypothetical protein [Caudoviricetes sp.]
MTREEILAAAQKFVCGDREQDYGSPERSFGVIGRFWETYLQEKCLEPRCGVPPEVQILPEDVAVMMCLFKIARIATGRFKEDSYIDAVGYMACAGEVASEEGKA